MIITTMVTYDWMALWERTLLIGKARIKKFTLSNIIGLLLPESYNTGQYDYVVLSRWLGI